MERVLWLSLLVGVHGVLGDSNAIPGSSRGIASGDELVASVIDSCFDGHVSFSRCTKLHALSYLDNLTGRERGRALEQEEEDVRSEDDARLDDLVLDRVQRFLKTHEFKVQLPEFVFQEALLTFKPSHGLGDFDVSFPPAPEGQSRAYSEARDMMQNKMLLPLLLLLKLKLKALTPVLLAIVGLKATKALFLSKLSILLVLGFLAAQLFKKAGMMPMMPPMVMEPVTPPPYGAPAGPAPPVTMSSYEPAWEPNQGGPYQRVWEPQQVVYSGYLGNQQSQNHQQSSSTV